MVDERGAGERAPFPRQRVLLAPPELGGGGIEGDHEVRAGAVARALDGLQHEPDGGLVAVERGGEAALVADGRAEAALVQDAAQGVGRLRAHTQALGEAGRARGHDHELLEIGRALGVAAPVEDVEHGHGQALGGGPAEVAVERLFRRIRRRARHRQGDAQRGVRPQPRLVGRAVQLDQQAVDGALVGGGLALEGGGDLVVHAGHGLEHAAPPVAAGVAVAQFGGLVRARGGPGGNRGLPHGAVLQQHGHVHRGVAARIEDLAGGQLLDQHRAEASAASRSQASSASAAVSQGTSGAVAPSGAVSSQLPSVATGRPAMSAKAISLSVP